jgi:hypothetical protein
MSRITMDGSRAADEQKCRSLEVGDLFFFPESPVALSPEDRAFLVAQRQVGSSFHKNVTYRPARDRLKGIRARNENARRRAHEIMRSYSKRSVEFMSRLLPRYTVDWKIDSPASDRSRRTGGASASGRTMT